MTDTQWMVFIVILVGVIFFGLTVGQMFRSRRIRKINHLYIKKLDERNKQYAKMHDATEEARFRAHEEGKYLELHRSLEAELSEETGGQGESTDVLLMDTDTLMENTDTLPGNTDTLLENTDTLMENTDTLSGERRGRHSAPPEHARRKLTREERARLLMLIIERSKKKAELAGVDFAPRMTVKAGLLPEEMITQNLKEREIISVFTNLLDNAIEAAARTEDRRFVKARFDADSLLIENGKPEDSHPKETGFTTSKIEDTSHHGIGTQVVRGIVQKRSLRLRYTDLGDTFRTELVLKTK